MQLSNSFAPPEAMILYYKNTPVMRFLRDDDYLHAFELIIPELLPEQLKYRGGISTATWLSQRSIDTSRSNARRLVREMGLRMNAVSIVLANNAMCITDAYAVFPSAAHYDYYADHIRFSTPSDAVLSLSTTGTSIAKVPLSPNAELTNIGSFDKAWFRHADGWWLHKRGTTLNCLGEMVAQRLCIALHLPHAEYEPRLDGIQSKNFADRHILEHYASYAYIASPDAPPWKVLPKHTLDDYYAMCFIDAVICNGDRHEFNFGVLKDDNGKVVSLAPNFDNNLSLGASQPLGLSMLEQLDTPVDLELAKKFCALDIETLLADLDVPSAVMSHLVQAQDYVKLHYT